MATHHVGSRLVCTHRGCFKTNSISFPSILADTPTFAVAHSHGVKTDILDRSSRHVSWSLEIWAGSIVRRLVKDDLAI